MQPRLFLYKPLPLCLAFCFIWLYAICLPAQNQASNNYTQEQIPIRKLDEGQWQKQRSRLECIEDQTKKKVKKDTPQVKPPTSFGAAPTLFTYLFYGIIIAALVGIVVFFIINGNF